MFSIDSLLKFSSGKSKSRFNNGFDMLAVLVAGNFIETDIPNGNFWYLKKKGEFNVFGELALC